ncbi:MAG: RDD family protein [Pseudomonadota bacterium]|nr:RDD family protein [Pseudomonadota bacterium]
MPPSQGTQGPSSDAAAAPGPTSLSGAALAALPSAGVLPRLLCALYEGLLLVGTLVLAGFVLVPLAHAAGLQDDDFRRFTRAWMMTVSSAYFIWFWLHGGQTLPMKTWHIRLCRADGRPLAIDQALLRMVLVWAGFGLLGAHFLWALFDRDRQFLHDRILHTRIVDLG